MWDLVGLPPPDLLKGIFLDGFVQHAHTDYSILMCSVTCCAAGLHLSFSHNHLGSSQRN